MKKNLSYKCRIYPNKKQEEFLANQFGGSRFVYNYFLNNRKVEYLNNKKNLNYHDDAKTLTNLKEEDGYKWLNNINAQSLQQSLRNLEVAYQRFFKKVSAFPKFHSKKNKQSFRIPQHFSIKENKLYIPKLKSGIEIVCDRPLPIKQFNCTISKTSSGKYYASFSCEEDILPLKPTDKNVGIDLGIKSLVICSDNKTFENKNFYRKSENKLKYLQRQLSKKQKGSSNRNKSRIKVAKLHEKISNQRSNYLHNITKSLINENQIIIAESLSVKNMIKNHCLAKSIQDASWRELVRQLSYKAEWYGRTFYQIDRLFPSSKTCNNCQFVLDKLDLSVRSWSCPKCKTVLDRDLNAAKNILDKGLKDFV